jgi:hypothetical protein
MYCLLYSNAKLHLMPYQNTIFVAFASFYVVNDMWLLLYYLFTFEISQNNKLPWDNGIYSPRTVSQGHVENAARREWRKAAGNHINLLLLLDIIQNQCSKNIFDFYRQVTLGFLRLWYRNYPFQFCDRTRCGCSRPSIGRFSIYRHIQ